MEIKPLKPETTVDSFYSLDVRFCQIEEVEDILKNPKKPFDEVDNPVKAYKLTVNTGFDKRTIVTNIVQFAKTMLEGTVTTFILNLPEANIRGFDSKGMIFMLGSNLVVGGKIGDIVI